MEIPQQHAQQQLQWIEVSDNSGSAQRLTCALLCWTNQYEVPETRWGKSTRGKFEFRIIGALHPASLIGDEEDAHHIV